MTDALPTWKAACAKGKIWGGMVHWTLLRDAILEVEMLRATVQELQSPGPAHALPPSLPAPSVPVGDTQSEFAAGFQFVPAEPDHGRKGRDTAAAYNAFAKAHPHLTPAQTGALWRAQKAQP